MQLARDATKREPADLRGFLSFVHGAYSADLALDVAATMLAASREASAKLLAAVLPDA